MRSKASMRCTACGYSRSPASVNQWEERWHGEGTSNKLPILSNQRPDNIQASDLFVNNGSYLRLRTLQLGYTFPKAWMEKIYLNKLRLYVNAQNLFTISGFNGWTPEVGGSPLRSGVDDGS